MYDTLRMFHITMQLDQIYFEVEKEIDFIFIVAFITHQKLTKFIMPSQHPQMSHWILPKSNSFSSQHGSDTKINSAVALNHASLTNIEEVPSKTTNKK